MSAACARVRLTLAFLLISAWPLTATLPARPQATFRGGVALVSVEVQVVDSSGRPAAGLTPAAFGVTIDGRRRQVVSADLVRQGSRDELSAAASAGRGSAQAGGRSQTFVIAIDAASFSTGDAVGVIQAARTFVDRAPEGDAVGVITLPQGGLLAPTVDRTSVKQALGAVIGLRGLEANPFNLTAAEVLDITAETGEMASAPPSGGRSSLPTAPYAARQVQLRECRGTAEQVCLQNIVIEANALARQFQRQTAEGIAGLMRLLRLLGEYSGRKTVVLLSAGMPVSDRSGGGWHRDGGEARALGQSAARANATVYSIHLDSGYRSVYNSEQRAARPNVSIARDREIEALILTDFALASGGALFSMPTGSGEAAFDRILRETSAVYLLGVTPDNRDFDGRPHELRVTLQDRGLTVRSRKFVMLQKEN